MSSVKETRGPIVREFFVPGQATAGTVDEWALFIAQYDLQVTDAKLVPNAAITANGTNYFTLTLTNKASGAGSTSIATRSWAATDSVAFTPEGMTLSGTAANVLVTSGQLITIARTVAASGLAMPDMTVQVTYKLTGV